MVYFVKRIHNNKKSTVDTAVYRVIQYNGQGNSPDNNNYRNTRNELF